MQVCCGEITIKFEHYFNDSGLPLMKIILLLIAIVFCFGCEQKQNLPRKENGGIKKESRFKNLLSKYKEKSFDTLWIYSPDEFTGELKGVELDSADAILFPEETRQENPIDPPGLFAVYKFQIDSNTLALITRTPSEYESSSILLFFFDKVKDSITSYLDIAQNWGDAGDVMYKDAWIFKNSSNKFECFVLVHERHYNSAENEKDTTVESWNNYYLYNFSNKAYEVPKNNSALLKRFSHLIEKGIRRK
jgi:hypothetical protein